MIAYRTSDKIYTPVIKSYVDKKSNEHYDVPNYTVREIPRTTLKIL